MGWKTRRSRVFKDRLRGAHVWILNEILSGVLDVVSQMNYHKWLSAAPSPSGKFCIANKKRKQYFAKWWVVTKVYYGQYKSGLYNEPYNSNLNLKPTNRPKTPCYKIFTVMTLCSLLQNNAHYIPPHFLLVKYPANLDDTSIWL